MIKVTREPKPEFIARASDTGRLYDAEDRATDAIMDAAREWAKLHDLPISGTRFWAEAMPQAIYQILESFDSNVSRSAAEAWLRDNPDKGVSNG